MCEYYLNVADQLLSRPEGVVPKEVEDRELFRLLSDFYLNPTQTSTPAGESSDQKTASTPKVSSGSATDDSLDFMIV